MGINSYKNLIVWQKFILLVKEIFFLTDKFSKTVISIHSNIAEGFDRKYRKEYKRGLLIAYASALEIETQIIIAKELHFALSQDYQTVEEILQEVLRMLNSLTATLEISTSH